MRRFLFREVRMGEMIPRGYGIAWRPWYRDVAVAMPLPLNVIVAVARWLYFTLMRPPVAWNDEEGRRRGKGGDRG